MKRAARLAVGILVMVLAASAAQAAAKKVKKADLPQEVQKTVDRESEGARVVALWQDDAEGAAVYEVDLKVAGHDKGILISEDGDVIAVQEEVGWDDLEAAVQEGLRKAAGDGKISKTHSFTQGGDLVGYGAEVERDGQTFQVEVDPDGQPRRGPANSDSDGDESGTGSAPGEDLYLAIVTA